MNTEIQIPQVSMVSLRDGLELQTLTRNERDILGEMSMAAFGAKSRWQKLVGKMKVIGRTPDEKGKVVNQYDVTSVDDVVKYMQKAILLRNLPEEAIQTMANLSKECFSNPNAWQHIYLGDPRPVEQSSEVFKELTDGMVKVSVIREFTKFSDEEKTQCLVEFFQGKDDAENDLIRKVPFVLLTKDEAATKAQLDLLPADLRDKVAPYIVTEFKMDESIAVDADSLISMLHPVEEATTHE